MINYDQHIGTLASYGCIRDVSTKKWWSHGRSQGLRTPTDQCLFRAETTKQRRTVVVVWHEKHVCRRKVLKGAASLACAIATFISRTRASVRQNQHVT